MRLSRSRLVLRSGLLLLGGGFMLWRAWEGWAGARLLGGAGRVLADRLALVEALVGLLAILTGVVALLSLRRRERRHSLHLPTGGGGGGPPPSA